MKKLFYIFLNLIQRNEGQDVKKIGNLFYTQFIPNRGWNRGENKNVKLNIELLI